MEHKRVRGLPEMTQAFQLGEKHTSKNAIMFMQETHSSGKTGKQWEQLWRRSIKFSHGTTSSKGVLIAFSEGLEFNLKKEFTDQNSRYIVLQVDIQGNHYVLINYHAPNLKTKQVNVLFELTKVLSNLELKENTNLILKGDFNLIINLNLDADGGDPTLKSNSMKSLNILTAENDPGFNLLTPIFLLPYIIMDVPIFANIWRIRNPESNYYTWRKINSHDAKKA